MPAADAVRTHVVRLLSWHDAHADFDSAVADVPQAPRGIVPAGLPYSLWQLLEHMRLTQRDILEFCEGPDYREKAWPDDYWPHDPAPPSPDAWDHSITTFRADREALQRMAADPSRDLTARVPAGSGQTYLREFLLVADHNAYHLGQFVAVRRLVGAWSAS
jgi:uncharacterized damage-inducible protein DinB